MKWGIAFLLFSSSAFALDYPYTLRSPTALLMGDAFTAVNDDEFTLFYNPASLARHKRDLTLNPINGYLSGTNILADMDKFEDFPEEPVGVGDVLMDYPVHAGVGAAPGLKFFNFGITAIAAENLDILLRNRAYPMLDIDLRSDRGVIMGVGVPIGPGRINKKSKNGHQTAIGVGAKYVERTGIRDTLALVGPTMDDTISQGDIEDMIKTLGQVKGRGWGFDAGIEHIHRMGNTKFVIGLSALDITGTEFKVDKNENDLKVASTKDQVNLGMAGGVDFNHFHFLLSSDIRGLNEQMDLGKRLRFGAQAGIPGLKLMAGVNSGYYSYGATVDLVFMKLSGGFYDVELGTKYKQVKSKRFILYLSLFDFSFDA